MIRYRIDFVDIFIQFVGSRICLQCEREQITKFLKLWWSNSGVDCRTLELIDCDRFGA